MAMKHEKELTRLTLAHISFETCYKEMTVSQSENIFEKVDFHWAY
jgi:hypothetical protein